jgi:phage shock protein A
MFELQQEKQNNEELRATLQQWRDGNTQLQRQVEELEATSLPLEPADNAQEVVAQLFTAGTKASTVAAGDGK